MVCNTKLIQTKLDIGVRFNAIAHRYDLLAALNPGYEKHLRWSAKRMALSNQARVLDLCCGTGISTTALSQTYPDATIDGIDISEGMLEHARAKFYQANVRFVHGDAMSPQALGIEGPYDGVLMAYGLRNVPDADACLSGIRSLLKPGGVLCLHEYSVRNSLKSRMIWSAVNFVIIWPSGLLTSPRSDIYRYLWRSVLDFDGVRELEGRLRGAGYTDVHTETMDGWQKDIVHSFVARAPKG
ncbi:MAG: class I SAM-dependent methyltransferase [Myxococcales bacterium]|nr:class I SAM-dependent methyltransferase [Myxococcales bacterium]MCB9707452.1 class I SAM-dependent methyltransferase [Myxococcales bacterium]